MHKTITVAALIICPVICLLSSCATTPQRTIEYELLFYDDFSGDSLKENWSVGTECDNKTALKVLDERVEVRLPPGAVDNEDELVHAGPLKESLGLGVPGIAESDRTTTELLLLVVSSRLRD